MTRDEMPRMIPHIFPITLHYIPFYTLTQCDFFLRFLSYPCIPSHPIPQACIASVRTPPLFGL